MSLPRRMQQAIKDRVLTPQEAQDWHETVESAVQEQVSLPERLHEAASRVWLWESPSANRLPV